MHIRWLTLLLLLPGLVLAETAIEQVKREAALGNAQAQYELGLMFATGNGVPQDPGVAAQWLIKSARQGDARAQYQLGLIYDQGKGIPPDPAQASLWYQQAAHQNHLNAQFALASIAMEQKNYEQAMQWYEQAALQGDSEAQYHIGQLYLDGKGVERSLIHAYAWFSIAAMDGTQEYAQMRDKLGDSLRTSDLYEAQKISDDILKRINP